MTHLHITSWVLAFILLMIVTMFYKQQKNKPAKILHMILRLDYLLILFSGGHLFAAYPDYSAILFIKIIVGIWAIAAMEMVSVGMSKNRQVRGWVIQLVVVSLVAIYLGFFQLPMGIYIG